MSTLEQELKQCIVNENQPKTKKKDRRNYLFDVVRAFAFGVDFFFFFPSLLLSHFSHKFYPTWLGCAKLCALAIDFQPHKESTKYKCVEVISHYESMLDTSPTIKTLDTVYSLWSIFISIWFDLIFCLYFIRSFVAKKLAFLPFWIVVRNVVARSTSVPTKTNKRTCTSNGCVVLRRHIQSDVNSVPKRIVQNWIQSLRHVKNKIRWMWSTPTELICCCKSWTNELERKLVMLGSFSSMPHFVCIVLT